MNKMRNIFALLIVLAAFSIQSVAQNNVLDEVVWIVGDEPILKSDVEIMRLSLEHENAPVEGDPYAVIPEQLAVQKLFLHQAELDSIEVSESDVADDVNRKIEELVQQVGSEEALEMYRRQSIKDLRRQLTKMYVDQQKIDQVRRNIIGTETATPAEVRRYFKLVPEDSLPLVPEQVEIQIITETPMIPQTEIDRVKAELMDYAERINNGSSFAALARMYSQDGSAEVGGELGFTGRAEWVKEFADVAFSLTDPKTVSKIVRTEFGYHIIQLIERKGDKVNCRHILRRPEISEEELSKTQTLLDSVATLIRDNKITFDQAVYMYSEDTDTRNNHGLMSTVDMTTGMQTSRFTMSELHYAYQSIAKQVENMQVGEVSNAFRMQGNKGLMVCSVIKLKNRIPEHKADITADFQLLKGIVDNKRSEDIIENWIKNKISTTYVKIKDDWKRTGYKYNWLK